MKKQAFTIENISTNFEVPIVTYFRDFSAPVVETDTNFNRNF